MKWTHLIRFESDDGKVWQGDAVLGQGITDAAAAREARTINGDPFSSYTWGPIKPISKLLSPLGIEQVRTVRCLGLNFRKHAAESGMPEPKWPVLITKPSTAIAGPTDPVPVPPMAQAAGAIDYEVELVVVIGRPCRNVSPTEASEYIAGYAVGNDVSQREWQIRRGGGQWNVSKMFDGWAPFGPAIVASSELAGSLDALRMSTRVNGELRQSELTGDMIFGPQAAVSFLSQGATLLPGDLIFLGTPAGVGMGFKPEPKWLQNGDKIECSIDKIGRLVNRIEFATAPRPIDLRPVSKPSRWWFSRL